jgi:hypothetical protein
MKKSLIYVATAILAGFGSIDFVPKYISNI